MHALTTFSSHLAHLASTLPTLVLSRIYRRVVSHISNHIQQRAVYSGWSKFTATGGTDLASEVEDWRQTSASAITAGVGGAGIDPDAPWRRLVAISRILAIPSERSDAGVTFSQAMAAAWSDSEDGLETFWERLGVGREGGAEMTRLELQGVLRRRGDCWR
jgi:hypothetical protein